SAGASSLVGSDMVLFPLAGGYVVTPLCYTYATRKAHSSRKVIRVSIRGAADALCYNLARRGQRLRASPMVGWRTRGAMTDTDDKRLGITVLGSTGSIGRQTLDVVRAFPERFRV